MLPAARPPSASSPPLGEQPPLVRARPPGPLSRRLAERLEQVESPAFGARRRGRAELAAISDVEMGPIVYAEAQGSNVVDVDGNRYVDLAAGFGAMSLGHRHPRVERALDEQRARLWMALGDLYSADAKLELLERLAALYPKPGARVLLGQSGADAVTAAIKTAALATGKPGLVAFEGAYHGLGYGPLAACGLKASFREPFAGQLNPRVTFAPYPRGQGDLDASLDAVRRALARGDVGAVLVEPVLGRGGCRPAPEGFVAELVRAAEHAGALVIADEIWTGLGRSGRWLASAGSGEEGPIPHLVCLGKALGGGLPISACIGANEVMSAWMRPPEREVVHTATFHGAPLACATSLATLDLIAEERLDVRSSELGARLCAKLAALVARRNEVLDRADRPRTMRPVEVRGMGLMLGIDWGDGRHAARANRELLERGYIATLGGLAGEVTILTPPLTIEEALLDGFVETLADMLDGSEQAGR